MWPLLNITVGDVTCETCRESCELVRFVARPDSKR